MRLVVAVSLLAAVVMWRRWQALQARERAARRAWALAYHVGHGAGHVARERGMAAPRCCVDSYRFSPRASTATRAVQTRALERAAIQTGMHDGWHDADVECGLAELERHANRGRV